MREWKVGDLALCVNVKYLIGNISKNKIYKIIELSLSFDNPANNCIRVVDNDGKTFGYYAWRFVNINELLEE